MNNQTTSLEYSHFPVMLNEVLKISSPITNKKFIDCTFGGGGYSKEILKFSKTNIKAIDRDKKTLSLGKKLEQSFPNRFRFYQIKFSQLDSISDDHVDAVIFDLGLSSIQLDDLERGFSFKSNKKLNMTMGLNEISALDVINNLDEGNLKLIIKILGDEKEASKIAKNIVSYRNVKKITNTSELVKIIEKSKKKIHTKKINPCTKTFQALRIFVNKEITELIYGVVNATKNLKPGGKILVISFHSLEDRIIKYYFTNFSKNKSRPSRYLPESKITETALFDEYKNKIFRPSKKEIEQNNRSRSAKLRFAVRSNNKFEYPKDLITKFKKYLDLEAINV
ncbi:MAG: 16S rRNA (cytosine(1402)-N(4))-methyltransferase RsmH [Candidatus Pelagibacter sp. TMED286]|nr:MAG: 16S rRNA (cytosine(1402)-N(4))-methyltransferase RsmH [Candidatus Pelagibacter sp. TMED286]|tara:strand:+ start:2176 stop:3186 length:1011 start_codon:yes stop_codon:yes gene_type:complete